MPTPDNFTLTLTEMSVLFGEYADIVKHRIIKYRLFSVYFLYDIKMVYVRPQVHTNSILRSEQEYSVV